MMERVQYTNIEKLCCRVNVERRMNNKTRPLARNVSAHSLSAAEQRVASAPVHTLLYYAHFGLREHPFALTPDTGYFFDYFNYREALNAVLGAICSGEGIIKLIGEVGMGKTMLCRRIIDALGDDFVTAYVPCPLLSGREMLKAVAGELQLLVFDGMSSYDIIKEIKHCLIQHNTEGKSAVLLIDEAQMMSQVALEALLMLSSITAENKKLFQVVLLAQPELDQRLGSKKMRHLQQRITFSHQLQPLDKIGLTGYINRRIMLAGYNGGAPFSAGAITELYRASGGVPRLINILCHKSLILAYGKGVRQVTGKMVCDAERDTDSLVNKHLAKLPHWWNAASLFLRGKKREQPTRDSVELFYDTPRLALDISCLPSIRAERHVACR